MRFWLKIGLLSAVTYLACYASLLMQDRQEHHEVVREVEAATRAALGQSGPPQSASQIHDQLNDAQARLTLDDARFRRDASRLLLLAE